MAKPTKSLEERLQAHPHLMERLSGLLELAESGIDSADEVEALAVEGSQGLGRQVVQDWAEQQAEVKAQALRETDAGVKSKGKKRLYWTTTLGEIAIEEEIFGSARGVRRPFSEAAGVVCRGYSLLIQRRITDFGSEKSFERASRQVKEHYGLEVGASAVRRITQEHGQRLHGKPELVQGNAPGQRAAAQLIAETDGSMIPIVTRDPAHQGDQRKSRQLGWKEARLGLVYEQGTVDPVFGASTEGVDQAGDQLGFCAARIGLDAETQIHGVGDEWVRADLR